MLEKAKLIKMCDINNISLKVFHSGHNKFKQCLKAEMVVAKTCLKTGWDFDAKESFYLDSPMRSKVNIFQHFSKKSIYLYDCNSKTNHCKYLKFSPNIYFQFFFISVYSSMFYEICRKRENSQQVAIEKTRSIIKGKFFVRLNFKFLQNSITITIYPQTILNICYYSKNQILTKIRQNHEYLQIILKTIETFNTIHHKFIINMIENSKLRNLKGKGTKTENIFSNDLHHFYFYHLHTKYHVVEV
ncbi:hypothetical protein AGLY_010342 [Aphis glycines]|uniref:Uncharacterized protein n=1 Tax=Aphis glycines TaxID=307491 RepID=A0A6G0THZ3_APHGL|nr:hypothetical protein AGLY_010342 [Aphis glycines]